MNEADPVPEFVRQMAAEAQDAQRHRDRQQGLVQALHGILDAAVSAGLCDVAGITERHGQKLKTVAATDPLAVRADLLQYELGEGPCVQAAFEDGVKVSQDLHHEPQWPVWAAGAAELGVQSVLSVHLYTAQDSMGALNLYSRTPRVYDSRDLETAYFMGSTTSLTLANHRNAENLWAAIDARHRIGTAQGILIGKYDLTVDQSFAFLTRLSSHHEQKMAVIATRIIQAKGLPPELKL